MLYASNYFIYIFEIHTETTLTLIEKYIEKYRHANLFLMMLTKRKLRQCTRTSGKGY